MKVSSGSLPEVAVVVSWIFQRFAGGRTSGLRGTCSNHVPVARTGWWLETFFLFPCIENDGRIWLYLTDIFQMGWNHPENVWQFYSADCWSNPLAGCRDWPLSRLELWDGLFFHTPSGRTWYAVLNRWFLGELHDFGGSWSVWCVEVYRAGIPWALLDSIHLCMVHDSEICLWSALHEMHSVVPIRYGSKSIPPKWIGYHFCGLFCTPFLTHTQFDFYLVQSGSLRLWGGGKTSS